MAKRVLTSACQAVNVKRRASLGLYLLLSEVFGQHFAFNIKVVSGVKQRRGEACSDISVPSYERQRRASLGHDGIEKIAEGEVEWLASWK